jgi:hypothetical protein
VPEHLDIEVKIAKQYPAIDQDIREIWEKSSYTCPECHGVLLRLKENGRERFRCILRYTHVSDWNRILIPNVLSSGSNTQSPIN